MNKSINDNIFGKLVFDTTWNKLEKFTLWDSEYELQIVIEPVDGNDFPISDKQRYAYTWFKENISTFSSNAQKALLKYCHEVLNLENCTWQDFLNFSEPIELYFSETGDWAMLFESEFEQEHGLAFASIDGQWEVGFQDIIF